MRELRPLRKQNAAYIDREEELAAIHYARAYPRWLRKYNSAGTLNAVTADGMPRGSDVSDPTARAGMERAALRERMEKVEQTALAVAPDWPDILLEAVTASHPIPYADLVEMGIPVGRNSYYEARRAFYALLAAKI